MHSSSSRVWIPALALAVAGLAHAQPEAPPAAAPAAIASTDGDFPNLRAEITELKRTSGSTVTLKFAMINDADRDFALGQNFADSSVNNEYHEVGGVHLVDAANKKKYLVLRDSEKSCLCSRGVLSVKARSRASLWAKFPAPPEDVQKITVVIPHFIPMDDVAIGH